MKLFIFTFLLTATQVHATGAVGQNFSANLKNAEIKRVLTVIERRSDFRFMYNYDLKGLDRKVNFNVQNISVTDALNQLLSGTSLTYRKVSNNLIAIFAENDAAAIKEIIVTGQVLDDSGAPVAGVSVIVKGTSMGTTSDANGNFKITAPNANAVLVFTAIGFEDLEQPLKGSTELHVVLKESQKVMDQVVVIGYGTATKRDLTGSIVKIEGKEIADKPNTNPIASLQGKVAGLSVVPYGTPGKTPDIRIRGTNSIGSIRPLYVVDGIFNDNIDFLNPNDIESIEILKDPSSLAIFGVRGANGVIAITTKRAKAGQVLVNFNSSFGAKKLTDKIKVLTSAEDFKTLYMEENDNIGASNTFDFTPWTGNTDWIDAVTQTGYFNNNNLSVTASTEKNKLYLGIGFTRDQGIVKHEQLKRYLINISDEFKISSAFKIGFTLNTALTNSPNDGTGNLEIARRIAPVVSAATFPYKMRIYGADSTTYNLYSALPSIQNTLQNPLVSRENTWNTYIGRENRFVGSLYGEVNFLRDFNFRAAFYGDLSYLTVRDYDPLYAAYDPAAQRAFLVNQVTKVNVDEGRWQKYQQDYILTYKKKIQYHNITATAGWTTYFLSENHTRGNVQQSLSGDPIPNDKRFWYLSNGFEDDASSTSSSSQKESATTSFLARVLYNFNNKYYFNASYRRDGSSLIYNPDERYLNMWALGGAWEISRENFMQSQKVFDFLKIKASIGLLGNQNTYGVDYPYFPTLAQGNTAVFGTNVYPAYVNTYEVDPNLHWETVLGKEAGIEFSMLNRRLNGEINYYHKVTRGMLAYLQNGPKRTLGNFGEIMNQGIELSAAWTDNITNDFSYSIAANLTSYKNKVLKFGTFLPASESSPNQTEVGYPIGYFYGYEVEGLYQSYADKLKSPKVVGYDYGPGDLKYKDINNDGVINTEDRTMIGNPTPDFTYGFSLGANYKGFDVSIDFNGSYGAEVYRVWGSSELPYSRYNYPEFKLERWHGEGTSNWVPRLGDKYAINRLPSTFGIEDGSYLRIRNIQLGYNFSNTLLSQIHVRSLRIFANIQNFKTFKNNLGYTPEFGGDPTYFGVDWGNGPIPIIYTGGINVTF